MSNVTIFADNCLRLANGNKDEAFWIACRQAIYWRENASPGFMREAPQSEPAIPRKPMLVDPVLLESERTNEPTPLHRDALSGPSHDTGQ